MFICSKEVIFDASENVLLPQMETLIEFYLVFKVLLIKNNNTAIRGL